jgi:hypothetical protein
MTESFDFDKKEVLPNPEANLESIVQSLRDLPGPEFMNQLRKLKAEHPDLEALIEDYDRDKRFRKDILHGLFFLKKEEPGYQGNLVKDPEFLKDFEHYYYPENTLKQRRYMRRARRISGTIIGGLALAAGVTIHEAKQNLKDQEEKEQTWEKQKLPLSIQEIDQQADTIFQSIAGNFYLDAARDTLEKNIEQHFDEEYEKLEVSSRTKITDYLDSIQSNNPELFKSLVLEYWKSKNDLPSNYYNIAYSPGNIEDPIKGIRDNFSKKQEELRKTEETLLARIQKAYVDAGGSSYSYQQGLKDIEQQETSAPEKEIVQDNENKTNPEYLKFKEHVDSLANADSSIVESYKKFSDAVNSPLEAEVRILEGELQEALKDQEREENNAKDNIRRERDQKVQELRNQDVSASNLEITTMSETFDSDVWAYLEDFYLVDNVFDGKLRDTTSENSLKAMSEEASVKEALAKLMVLKEESAKKLGGKLNEINATFDQKEQKTLEEIRRTSEGAIAQIKEKLAPKKEEYTTTWEKALTEYYKKYNKLWNDELEKQNITSINPR